MPENKNRRLAVTMFISLDGVVESPHKWSFPFWNEEIGKFKHDETFASDALLLGRVTYEASRPRGLRGKTRMVSRTGSTACRSTSSRRP